MSPRRLFLHSVLFFICIATLSASSGPVSAEVRGLGVGHDGRAYVLLVDASKPTAEVRVFDMSGARVGGFTPSLGDGSGSNVGLALGPAGTLWISCASALHEFDSSGKLVRRVDLPPTERGDKPYKPSGVALGADGNIFVVQQAIYTMDASLSLDLVRPGVSLSPQSEARRTSAACVLVLESTGQTLGRWGSGSAGDEALEGPVALTTDVVGNLYVVDQSASAIRVFDHRGVSLRRFAVQGPPLTAELKRLYWLRPELIAADPKGSRLYVGCSYSLTAVGVEETLKEVNRLLDALQTNSKPASLSNLPEQPVARVCVFDIEGRLVTSWPVEEWRTVQWSGLAVASTGEILVAEETGLILVFAPDGRLLRRLKI